MPPQNNQNQPSPFEITTSSKSKKGGGKGVFVAILIVLFLILSVVAGVLLVRQRQNIQEKAVVPQCPADEQCPVSQDPTHLRTCDFKQPDNSPDEELCNSQRAGIVSSCGGVKYCCPSIGADWTTNTSLCPAPQIGSFCQADWQCPTGAICNIPAGDDTGFCASTATESPSPSPSTTASPTASPTGTGNPNACNGNCGSDSNCQSGYICSGGFCRNPLCTSALDCICVGGGTATPTPTSTSTGTARPTATARPIPETGIDWPTALGAGVGAAAIILSILIAL